MEYSRRNGRAPLLVLLGVPVIIWRLVRPIKKIRALRAKTPITEEAEDWTFLKILVFVGLVMFGTCAFIFGQLYLSYEFLREGGALG
ncbi:MULTISPECIES: hypothetical protein [unclassified Pseudoclavibacter]|uniref:hypothetical protein n=1 Tax=unclassified Pseudoclavibacter TaxID=2615177 RepID=UPI0013016644|nr:MULTISPECIES: hypothetical protein [unclassified Pseudoclavibacter]KAB1645478.1 hypothetical protein F8O06_07760 [Pseudoclavibacter sp. CFCC 14310]KAB1646063.1 hypothetical protein F8O06_04685 [Pseudoclavibacter sp. CFCC 14310]KAB1663629.1 hypothetical protein F8O08_07860 [Pseudoclavibacter sp. CFCC 13611]KAB1664622.1 hypothetical protein F8O08_04420 [Pseudoclavibacter sp. CFCC 13611]